MVSNQISSIWVFVRLWGPDNFCEVAYIKQDSVIPFKIQDFLSKYNAIDNVWFLRIEWDEDNLINNAVRNVCLLDNTEWSINDFPFANSTQRLVYIINNI